MTLGEKLCKYRRERKMSQEEVAEKLNITIPEDIDAKANKVTGGVQ